MIKRVRDDVLTAVHGSYQEQKGKPVQPPTCKCGTVCPCTTSVDGATNFVAYNPDLYVNAATPV